ALQDFSAFLRRWRFIPQQVDVRQWIDRRPLDALLATPTALAG
ncbi:ABC transporter substrate-binding protein, partial [Pseudomonas sp. SIMBA_077]